VAARPGLETRYDTARSLCARARLAASDGAERLRAQLEPEQECPVCGAVDHPYATHSPREKAMLDSLQAAEEEAQQALARVDSELHALAARMEADTEARDRIKVRLAALDAQRQAGEASWSSHVLHGELASVAEQDRSLWLEQERQRLDQEIEALDQEGARHREALRLKDLAQAAVDVARVEADQAGQTCVQLETDQKTTAAESVRLDASLGEVSRQLDDTLQKLDAAFAGRSWRQDWERDAVAFVAHCAAEVGLWTGRQAEVDALSRTLELVTTALAGMHSATLQLGSRVQALSDKRRREEESLVALDARRAALLGGRAVSDVETTLAATLRQARARAEQTRQAQQAAVTTCAQREAETRQGEEMVRQLDDASQHAEQALQAWLGAAAAQEPDDAPGSEALRRLLAHDDTWLAGERAVLARLEQAVSSAQAVLEARQTTRSRHQTDSPAAEDADTLQATLNTLSAQLASAHTLLTTLKVEIARDDSRRQESEELRRQLDRQGARTRVWSQLGELIGSADGRKFRNYAQQLTLDILLGYANRHLESLARRYRLMRIEDSLGLLVIDQEMGDETRSVHSLSGGESFLVSLSLALGLASLSSHRVSVESLFIDEGFGSLDAEALNVAMEALDRLQALGRKVGIISHVQEMTERIGTRIQVSRQSGGLSRVALSWS
jgi:exonuclease SbcC